MHALCGQVVNAHGVLIEAALELGPTGIVTQTPQDNFKPIVREIEALDVLSSHRLEGEQPSAHPGLDMHETVIASGQNGTKPDGADPAQAESIAVAVGRKMRVNQRR